MHIHVFIMSDQEFSSKISNIQKIQSGGLLPCVCVCVCVCFFYFYFFIWVVFVVFFPSFFPTLTLKKSYVILPQTRP